MGVRSRREALWDILDQSTNEIYVIDVDTLRFTYVNNGAVENLGYSRDELLELTPIDLSPAIPSAGALRARMQPIISGGERELVYETAHRRKDGSEYPVELHIQASELDGRPVLVGVVLDVSERVIHRRQLEASERRFRAVAQAAPSAMVVADRDGVVTFWNAAAEVMFGHSREEILGRPLTDLLPKRYVKRYSARAMRLLVEGREGVRTVRQMAAQRKDGTEFPVEVSLASWTVDGVVSISALIRDVTEAESARVALEDSLKEQQGLIEQLPAVVYTAAVGDDCATLWISPQIEEALGVSPEAFVADPGLLLKLVHPEDRERVLREARRGRATRQPTNSEFRVVHADGSVRWFRDRFTVRTDREGTPTSVRGVLFDITVSKEIEQRQALLSAAVEQSANLIVITDAEGVIEYVNPAFEEITGYTMEEVLGENPRILKSGVQDQRFYAEMWAALNTGRPWLADFSNQRKDGSLFRQRSTVFPIHDATGKTVNYVSIGQDVTKELALEDQLRQSQKVESIGLLAGGIAHDFNNLLTAILTNAEFVRNELPNASRQLARDLRAIRTAARSGRELVRKLMAFAREEELDMVVRDLSPVIGEAVQILRRVLPETIEVRHVPAGKELPVRFNETAISQILMNLGTNARDAMPDGGEILLSVAEVVPGEVPGLPSEAPALRYAHVSVRDEGVGMSEEARSRIYDPFFTTKPQGKGTGLGMAQVFGLVEHHGGYITVDSAPAIGTTVSVFFPLSTSDLTAAGPPAATEPYPRGTESILLVEDEPSIRTAGLRVLENLGYEVVVVEDGAVALGILKEGSQRFDLVVSDLVMPNMGGAELFQAAQALGTPIPRFLFTSGYSEGEALGELERAELGDILPKPWEIADLARAVRRRLDEGAA